MHVRSGIDDSIPDALEDRAASEPPARQAASQTGDIHVTEPKRDQPTAAVSSRARRWTAALRTPLGASAAVLLLEIGRAHV